MPKKLGSADLYHMKSKRVSDTFKTFNNKNSEKNIYAQNIKSKTDCAI